MGGMFQVFLRVLELFAHCFALSWAADDDR